MANKAGTIEIIARELGLVFKPLENLLTPYFTEILGVRLPDSLANKSQWQQSIGQCQQAVAALIPVLDQLSQAIADEDEVLIASEGIALIQKSLDVINAMKQLANTLNSMASGPGLSSQDIADLQAFAGDFVRKLIDYLIIENIETRFKANAALLNISGILERRAMPGIPGNPLHPPFIQKKLYFERISDLLKDPADYMADAYKWGTAAFEAETLLKNIQEFVRGLGLPAEIFQLGGVPTLEAFLFSISKNSAAAVPKLDFTVDFPATQDFVESFPIQGVWSSTVNIGARFEAGFKGTIAPPFDIDFEAPSINAKLLVAMGVKAEDPAGPMVIFGKTGSSRLEAQQFTADLGVETNFNGKTAKAEPVVRSAIRGGRLVIDFSEGDGFITSALSGIKIEGPFEILAKWQPSKGLQIQGSGGIEIVIPAHINLGIAEINRLYFILGIDAKSAFKLEVSSALSFFLGPFQASVDRMGLNAFFNIADKRDGNLGPIDAKFAFKPPTGIGISINTGVVIGGGYISFDPDKGEYAGVAELTVINLVSVKAIAIINTKLPDGSKGFAFLLLITAEFTPIQLGFGFTLNGVGGLIAINRGINTAALVQGVRENTTDSVLFPENPVANAPMIIASLNAFFPINKGTYAFGFMGILGWGTPSLITLELGFMFTFPEPVSFIILGILKMQLPDEKVPLVNLQVNFLGEINFTEKYIFFFASLYGSRIAQWTISGEMYFSIEWGGHPNFVFSVGGFHPSFVPPPLKGGIGQLQRITMNLLAGDNPRLTLTFYLAVTSNTVQFGAAADFMAKAWKIRVVGYLYFDALFQFNPFYFRVDVGAGLAVMWGSRELFGIHFSGSLEGPSPWRIQGKASFRILFVKVKVRVDKTFGERKDTVLPPVQVLPFIKEPLQDIRNWVAFKPDARNLLVTTRKLDTKDLVVHPYSVIGVSQNRVPLNQQLDKIGSNKPGDYIKFKLRFVSGASEQKMEDFFAPAEYIKLSNEQKLSRKSFELFASGTKAVGQDAFSTGEIRKAGDGIFGDYVEKTLTHEVCIIDKLEEDPVAESNVVEDFANFQILVQGNAVGRSSLGRAKTQKNAVLQNRVKVGQEAYHIVDKNTMTPISQSGVPIAFNSEAQAKEVVGRIMEKQPKLIGVLQVISKIEKF